MKVLCYLQPGRQGGVARHSIEMVRGLLSRPGITGEILVAAPNGRDGAGFMEHFRGIEVKTHVLPGLVIERLWKLFGMPRLTGRCRGFDVVYCPADVVFPACGIPRVVTLHDVQPLEENLPWSNTEESKRTRRRWRMWLPAMLRQSERIATVSNFSKERIVALADAKPERVAVVGNGVSPIFLNAKSSAEPPRSSSVVVIGGLRFKKGAEQTLRVAAELSRRGSPVTIDVFGPNDEEWAKRAAAYSNVRLHGSVDDATIAASLGDSLALLFLTLYEGFGIPALEAMAAGTPPIVSNNTALPEVVGDAGVIVEPEETGQIGDQIEKLRTDAAFRAAMVRRGRQHVAAYTWEQCIDRLMAVMQECVHDGVPARAPVSSRA
jgi:glycosyltransferase involved in cell wall biosynthesis